ncbi:hypothetical protein [Kluyvera intermedia]|uniref:hypothetical protein n=1 Tax=Kluyvera intermedia TaxID=61648 RepID=UPI00372CFD5A
MTNKLKAMLDDAKELNALGLMSDSDVSEINSLLEARIATAQMISGEDIKTE